VRLFLTGLIAAIGSALPGANSGALWHALLRNLLLQNAASADVDCGGTRANGTSGHPLDFAGGAAVDTSRLVHFGWRLRQLRSKRDLNVDDVMRETGVPSIVIVRYENGEALPSSSALDSLIRLYKPKANDANSVRDEHAWLFGQYGDRVEPNPVPGRVLVEEPTQRASCMYQPDGGIFLSYRRADDPAFAGRLYDRLKARFCRDRVFMDVDTIELGVDFVEELNTALSQCAALIAVIGPRWLAATNPFGQRRLHDPDDFVRLEIEHALQRNVRVIPVLVDSTPMPRRQDLPESLAPLVRRNGQTITHARFGSDSHDLISTLERILAG
jgi:hypothetical protein